MSITDDAKRFQQTSFGNIAYLETGKPGSPPVLFVHGIPTSSYLWREVIRFLQHDFHCVAPDLMGLGDTEVDPDRQSFDMEAQAEMLLEFMHLKGFDSFNVVCHDQGGAAAQIIASTVPDRVESLVLTDCVCYDNWPVPVIAFWQQVARVPLLVEVVGQIGLIELFESHTPWSAFRNGVYQAERMSNEAILEYLKPLRKGAKARKAFQKFLLAGNPRFTLQAVEGLKRFTRPTFVIWAAEDRYISPSWGRKLAEDIPGTVDFELVPFCGHFWQEERPAEFASRIGEFLSLFGSLEKAQEAGKKGKKFAIWPNKKQLREKLGVVTA